MSSARFAYTIIYVPDVAQTIAFYEAAFGLTRRFIGEDGDYGELSTGDVTLAFAGETLAETTFPDGFVRHRPGDLPQASEIAFTTGDVPGQVARAIDAGATLITRPERKPWGQTVAYVRDPDGIVIEICTPMQEE